MVMLTVGSDNGSNGDNLNGDDVIGYNDKVYSNINWNAGNIIRRNDKLMVMMV